VREGLSARGWVYLTTAVVAPFAALALGDPAPVLVVAPMVVVLVFRLMMGEGTPASIELFTTAERTVEGGTVSVSVTVSGSGSVAHVRLWLPTGARIVETQGAERSGRTGLTLPMRAGEGHATVRVCLERWGNYRLARGQAWVTGLARMYFQVARCEHPHVVTVLPDVETTRRLVSPTQTSLHVGDLVSSRRGPGFELAELRLWAPGDPPRAINWRATARSSQTWVNQHHADRNADLILVVDSFIDPGSEAEEGLAMLVRLAASLIDAYGKARNRVGLISLAGHQRWFGLDSGAVHHERLLSALLDTQAASRPVWMAVDRILSQAIRPPSMVVFVSPLLDEGVRARISLLAHRGVDVAVVALDVSSLLRPPRDRLRAAARRVWEMELEMTVDGLREQGVAVGLWSPLRSLDQVLEEVESWRRLWRRARV
jgi:uncharacterized protein (DUF58 family)